MALKLITPAADYPVTLAEAKRHCRAVEFDDDDAIIEIYMAAATAHAEAFLGKSLVDQTWELTLDAFPDGAIQLPRGAPLIEVVSVAYDDGAGDEQILATTSYTVDLVSEPAWIVAPDDTWPTPFDGINAVRVRYRAGYVDYDDSPPSGIVPSDIKAAVLLYVGTLYANRETIVIGQTAVEMPWASEQLLRPHRILLGMA